MPEKIKKPTISVIIPVYNEERYIERCLESITDQSLKPEEIIVVDDGSTDNSRLIINKQKSINRNLKLIKQKHSGPAKARNLGAKYAKGNILVFVDADMKFGHKYLEKLIQPIVKAKALATFTKEEYVANPENLWSRFWNINSYLPIALHIDPKIPDKTNTFRAISRDLFRKTGGYKSHGYTDDITVLHPIKKNAVVAPGAVCDHFNPESLPEVFYSARWMGRDSNNKGKFFKFFIFSLPWSFVKSIYGTLKLKNIFFLPFKLSFDFGFFLGLIDVNFKGINYK